MKLAFIFPGQGAQYVGMGRDLYENFGAAREIFDRADETLGFPLSRLCFEGPEDELRQTINAQPAIVTVSFACYRALVSVRGEGLPVPAYIAGHSLGEYTALAAAGILDFSAAVSLARERGRLMHEAGARQPGGMAAVIGLDEGTLQSVCDEAGVWLANINCPGQLVVSGAEEGLAQAMELAKAKGAGRAVRLQVSGAFHSPLMQPAVEGMAEAIARASFALPNVPLVGNTTARPVASVDEIKAELLTQLCNCVRWQQSVEYMLENGVSGFVEIGPGKVLTGLVKRINKNASLFNIGDAVAVKDVVLG